MAAPLLPVIVQENWAQCENPNCNKWRRLPPGHQVKEDEPWYCYLNPDAARATCSASEDVSRCLWALLGLHAWPGVPRACCPLQHSLLPAAAAAGLAGGPRPLLASHAPLPAPPRCLPAGVQ